jgi:pimeloyl-ACP methyl ester carboxylesterase
MRTGPDRYTERDGARLRWRLEGSGPAIALLHGWALDLQYWDPAVELLAPRFTVLRFDRRGFGLSGPSPDSRRNADDLQALLDAAALERVVLLGMSQGARLALQFALLHPDRVRALLLDGAPSPESSEPELPMAEYRRRLGAHGAAALQAEILRHPLMQLQTRDPSAHRLLAGIVARYRGLDLLQPVAREAPLDPAAIAVPTLVINGEFDSAARREAGQRLQAAIPGARRVELPGTGHLALLDCPAAYVQAVTEFCVGLPR